jgi:hypothetical protein
MLIRNDFNRPRIWDCGATTVATSPPSALPPVPFSLNDQGQDLLTGNFSPGLLFSDALRLLIATARDFIDQHADLRQEVSSQVHGQ